MRKIKIIASRRDLEPGDLFSTADQTYWDNANTIAVGEKVYIRTNNPSPRDQEEMEVYKITITYT